MIKFGVAAVVLLCMANGNAWAQGVLYTAPGVDLSYGFGFDVGQGVQIGYGYGVGIPLSPVQLMSTVQGPYQPPINYDGIDRIAYQEDYSSWHASNLPTKKVKIQHKGKKAK